MAENTKIEWATHTVNFWWGCMKVSEGCANCYAETLSHRFGKSIWGPAATTSRERKSGAIANLRKWNKQAAQSGETVRVFAQSMSDFFEDHPQLPRWRDEAFEVMEASEDLIIMLLTKRPENIARMVPSWWLHDWPGHIQIGTSVENQEQAHKRLGHLVAIPAAIRFVSAEPLLGPLNISRWLGYRADMSPRTGIDWVIVGGESGHGARPMHPHWARSLRDQCVAAGVAFHFKQWGEWFPYSQAITKEHRERFAAEQRPGGSQTYFGARIAIGPQGPITGTTPGVIPESIARIGKAAAGRTLDGRTWDEFPAVQP